jgi:hypothetical protein
MKKWILWLVIIALTLGGLYAVSQYVNKTQKKKAVVVKQKTEPETLSGSIVDFLGKGKNVKCTWDSPKQGKGVMYISGKKFYSEGKLTGPKVNKTTTTFLLNDGEWMYVWNSDSTTGTKMNVLKMQKQAEATKSGEKIVEPGKIDYSKFSKELLAENNFNCNTWVNFGGVFDLPKNIEFKDITVDLEKLQQTTEKISGTLEEMKKSACDICASLSGDTKTKCLAACE